MYNAEDSLDWNACSPLLPMPRPVDEILAAAEVRRASLVGALVPRPNRRQQLLAEQKQIRPSRELIETIALDGEELF